MPLASRSDVQRVLDERVLPLVRADGGEIELVDVTPDGVVRVRLGKACAGCPGSQFTVGALMTRELEAAVKGFREIEILAR
jgi:Fe-S cluster biogenesis protein NfuA